MMETWDDTDSISKTFRNLTVFICGSLLFELNAQFRI